MSARITLPWPHRDLWPNRLRRQGHWGRRASLSQMARLEGNYACRAAHLAHRCFADAEQLHVTLTFRPPSRRRFDDDGAIGAMKAYRDGAATYLGCDDAKWTVTYRRGEPDPLKVGFVEMEVTPA